MSSVLCTLSKSPKCSIINLQVNIHMQLQSIFLIMSNYFSETGLNCSTSICYAVLGWPPNCQKIILLDPNLVSWMLMNYHRKEAKRQSMTITETNFICICLFQVKMGHPSSNNVSAVSLQSMWSSMPGQLQYLSFTNWIQIQVKNTVLPSTLDEVLRWGSVLSNFFHIANSIFYFISSSKEK